MALIKGCPGAVTFRQVRPEDIVCPQCGNEVEIWSDEPLARCRQASAKECIGLAKYERLMKNRPLQTAAEENAA
jgi:DNA-directed RNA polymerase subunit RPC12/RpoP